jgi:hypothetical protein
MSLCRSIGADGSCSGDGLPGPTVFQAGANSQYIVLARHPSPRNGRPNRSITEFYYILRQADERNALKSVSVMGRFGDLEYQQENSRLQLPEFSKVFADLK